MGQPPCRHGQGSSSEVSRVARRTRGTEPSQYPEEEKSTEIPGVAASERGRVQTSAVFKIVFVAVGGLWGSHGVSHEAHGVRSW
jgi:hypothetical protein